MAPRALRCNAALIVVAVAWAVASCGGESRGADQPLAETTAAQSDYRNLRAHFFAAPPDQRARLLPELERFLREYPHDERGKTVALFQAWIAIDRDDLSRAKNHLAQARGGHSAKTALSTITEAAIATRSADPERALGLLEPLSGKVVDPDERLLQGEELVRAALSARRFEVAVKAMLEWLLQAPADQYDAVRKNIQRLVSQVPTDDLFRSLETFGAETPARGSSEWAPAREWLKKAVFTELGRRALEASDANLARDLLPHAPASLRASALYASLSRASAAGRSTIHTAGRALGLLLSLGTEASRKRSTAVATGMSRALAEGSLKLDLLIRDDAGLSDTTGAMLSRLAADGAAILVAGVDDVSSQQAAAFAERFAIPVLILQGKPQVEATKFSFVLGADRQAELSVLTQGLAERGKAAPGIVGEAGTPCDGASAGLTLALSEFRQQKKDSFVVFGDQSCALDLGRELARQGSRAPIACGLECTEATGLGAGPVLGVRAGQFPFTEAGRRPSFYEALGHDAAELGRAALAGFPEQRAVDESKVDALHELALKTLEKSEVLLWTSEARGFAGGRTLARSLGVVDVGSESGLKGKPDRR